MSYNFLLLIFLVVLQWVFPGLGSSASILKNTARQGWESPRLLPLPARDTGSSLDHSPSSGSRGRVRNQGEQRHNQATQSGNPNSIYFFSSSLFSHLLAAPSPSLLQQEGPRAVASSPRTLENFELFREHSTARSESQVFMSLILSTFSLISRRCCSAGANIALLFDFIGLDFFFYFLNPTINHDFRA